MAVKAAHRPGSEGMAPVRLVVSSHLPGQTASVNPAVVHRGVQKVVGFQKSSSWSLTPKQAKWGRGVQRLERC
jgi:hypothetical protein